MTLAGFPHSGISGSLPTCGSPKLFAAYHALLRLSVPRHPPCALDSLDRIFKISRPTKASTSQLKHTLGALANEPSPLQQPSAPSLSPDPNCQKNDQPG